MIGFVALGIVMLIWVLTWEGADESELESEVPPQTRIG